MLVAFFGENGLLVITAIYGMLVSKENFTFLHTVSTLVGLVIVSLIHQTLNKTSDAITMEIAIMAIIFVFAVSIVIGSFFRQLQKPRNPAA
jgi:hypothetical protein